jgi:hypothetical protein
VLRGEDGGSAYPGVMRRIRLAILAPKTPMSHAMRTLIRLACTTLLLAGLAAAQGNTAIVIGRVVDSVGDDVDGTWTVLAIPRRKGTPKRHAKVELDRGVGEFLFEGLTPGEYVLQATTAAGCRSQLSTLVVQANGEHHVWLSYDGPDPTGCLRVRLRTNVHTVAPVILRVRAAGGEVSEHFLKVVDGYGAGTLAELGPGPYMLSVEDSRFERVVLDDLSGESQPSIGLVGSASLELEVVDGDGAPLAWRELEIISKGRRRNLGLRRAVIRDLLPGRETFRILFGDRVAVVFEGPQLIAGETAKHRLIVDRGFELSLRFEGPGGTPAPFWTVQLGRDRDPEPGMTGARRSDDTGRVIFRGLAPGTYDLLARFDERWSFVARKVELREDLALTLTAPPYGWLVPEVALPPDLDPDSPVRATLVLRNKRLKGQLWGKLKPPIALGARIEQRLALDGNPLQPIPLPAGEYQLTVRYSLGGPRSFAQTSQAQVTVKPNLPTNTVLDLGDSYPEAVVCDLRVGGERVEGFELHSTPADHGTWLAAGNMSRLGHDDQGRQFWLASPGAYHLSLGGQDPVWATQTTFVVTRAPDQVLRLDLDRVTRRLRVLDDESGAVVPQVTCGFTAGEVWVKKTLDHQGLDGWRVETTACTLVIDAEGYQRAEVAWSHDLPAQVVLRLRR